MAYTARSVSVVRGKRGETDEPKKNDAKLSGPRMSGMPDLRDLLRNRYAAETATITVTALLIHSMLVEAQRTTAPASFNLRPCQADLREPAAPSIVWGSD